MAAYDVIVVGSGPNGLAAAVVAARAGLSVLVREANSTIGGGARSLELTLPGYLHDIGSAVHPMAAASPFFQSLPLSEYGLEWIQPTLPLVHPLDGEPPAILDRSIAATGRSISPDEEAYERLVRPVVKHWGDLLPEILSPMISVPAHPIAMAQFGIRALLSAVLLNKVHFRGPRAKALFAGLAGHSIVPLDRTATSAIGLVFAGTGHMVGWPIPRGGSQEITNALAAYLRSLGGVIECSAPVESMAELPQARAVLFDTSPRQLAKIASKQLPDSYLKQLGRYAYGPGIFKMDWALSAPIPWIDSACRETATVHIGGSAPEIEASESDAWNGKISEKPFVLLSQPTLFDATRAPAGQHTAWAYCHVPNGSTQDMTNAIESQIERFAPGFREVIRARSTRNTMQMEQSNPNLIGGDIGGGANNLQQLLFRPTFSLEPYRTPTPGIYICSSSTPPGGGVHGMCGYHAAASALKHVFGISVPSLAKADAT